MSRPPANADVFLAIADPTRRAILDSLRAGEQPVGALAGEFSVTLSAVSQQLRILREVGLVDFRKEGRERVYRLTPEPLQDVFAWAAHYQEFWGDRLDALARYLDETSDTIGRNANSKGDADES